MASETRQSVQQTRRSEYDSHSEAASGNESTSGNGVRNTTLSPKRASRLRQSIRNGVQSTTLRPETASKTRQPGRKWCPTYRTQSNKVWQSTVAVLDYKYLDVPPTDGALRQPTQLQEVRNKSSAFFNEKEQKELLFFNPISHFFSFWGLREVGNPLLPHLKTPLPVLVPPKKSAWKALSRVAFSRICPGMAIAMSPRVTTARGGTLASTQSAVIRPTSTQPTSGHRSLRVTPRDNQG